MAATRRRKPRTSHRLLLAAAHGTTAWSAAHCAAFATVLEPGIHTLTQTWQMKQRHHNYCAADNSKCRGRPGMLVVPDGVAHFLHLKTFLTAQVGNDGGWSGLESLTRDGEKPQKLVHDRSLSWARPMLEPYFESNMHYDTGTKRCERGKGPAYFDMDHAKRKTRAEHLTFLKEMNMGSAFGQKRCRPVQKGEWTKTPDPYNECCDPHTGLGEAE